MAFAEEISPHGYSFDDPESGMAPNPLTRAAQQKLISGEIWRWTMNYLTCAHSMKCANVGRFLGESLQGELQLCEPFTHLLILRLQLLDGSLQIAVVCRQGLD